MIERTGRLLCALVAAASTVAPDALALSDADEDVVLTPLRTETPPDQVASAMTVITGEELRQRQTRFVADALRAVPGLAVSRTGGVGGLTQVRIRGAEADHTLVMMDGIVVNDPVSGGYDFANLLVDDIERIEVIRGPQSVLYGSDAAAGVIHVITKRGRNGLTGRASYEHGSQNTNSGWGSVSGGTDRTRFSVSGHTLATRGISHADRDRGHHDEDEFRDWSLGGTVDWSPANVVDLGGSMKLIRSRIEDDDFGPVDGGNRTRLDQFFGGGYARFQFFDGRVQPQFRMSYTDTERDRWDRDAPGNPKTSWSDGERIHLDFQTNVAVDEATTLIFGIDKDREKGETDVIDDHVWTTGYFAQAQYAWRNRAFLTAGARLDDHDEFGTHATYRFTGSYHFASTGTRLKATWGTGFHAPNMIDLYFEDPFFVGNPDLDPERTRGWDVGIEQLLFGEGLRLGVTYFETRTKDLIAFVDRFPAQSTVENIESSTARGFEVSLAARPERRLTLVGSYTYTRTRSCRRVDFTVPRRRCVRSSRGDGDTHDALPRRPYHLASLNVNYRPLEPVEFDLGIYYNGRAEDTRSSFPDAGRKLDDFTLVNLAASFQLTRHVRIFGRVENMFDDDYEEITDYGSVGRSFYGGAEFGF